MNKHIKKIPGFIIIFILTFVHCASKQVVIEKKLEVFPKMDTLNKFFQICKSDIQKAVKVISDNQMVGNLTHLKKMDTGGKKYYLLERENLSDMIQSVTEGTYSDLILVNSKGTIIYTKINDEIFGKSVKHHYKNTALYKCFNESSKVGFHIEDVSIFPENYYSPTIFVSFPDKRNGKVKGIFVLQINIEIIENICEKNTIIIGHDGNYRVAYNRENILKPYPHFYKIDMSRVGTSKKEKLIINNQNYIYYPFTLNQLKWILISKI